MAKRIFLLSMGDQFVHRGDYTLYQLGKFNDQTGEITEPEPRFVLNGLSISPDMDPRPRPVATPTEENLQ
ncbi:nonstructural protein [Microviridae sp.]|nr:nonstructural protein [Microviridae sp.]